MSNEFGTDRRSLQNTTGSLQDDDGTPLLSTDTWGSASYALGPALATGIYTGVQNGIFSSPPSNVGTATPITDLNPLPYFSISDASSGRITAAAVEDTSQASGYAIRFSIATTAGTGGIGAPDKFTIKRLISVSASRAQSYSYVFHSAWSTAVAAAGSTTAFITGSAKYIAADGTTVVGGTSTTPDIMFNVLPTYQNGRDIEFVPNGNGIVPSTAAFLAIEIGVGAMGTAASVRTIDLYELRLERGQTEYRIVAEDKTNGTSAYGKISQDGTSVVIWAKNTTGEMYMDLNPTSSDPRFTFGLGSLEAPQAEYLLLAGTSAIETNASNSPLVKFTGTNLSLWQGGASGDIDFKDSAGSAFFTVNNAKNVVLQANGGYRQVGPPTTTQTASANMGVLEVEMNELRRKMLDLEIRKNDLGYSMKKGRENIKRIESDMIEKC
jgi:hypothetical protein